MIDPQLEFPASSDPLGEALHVLRMSNSFYSACVFTAPWALELPRFEHALMFHIVTAGDPWLEVVGESPRHLHPGDLALVPHGDGHILSSEPHQTGKSGPVPVNLWAAPRQELSERYEIIRIDGGAHGRQKEGGEGTARPTNMLCGTIQFDHPAADHLISLLPRLIVVSAESALHSEWITHTVRFLAAEARELRPGGETVVTRLADVLVIQAIRTWIAGETADSAEGRASGWLLALRDPQIGPALVLIHRNPAEEWSVERLANEVAMSRSAFAARFTALVGETPMHYVTRWRMQIAATSLREGKASLAELALRLGYTSESAFSRAFKRVIGIPPGAVRRAGPFIPADAGHSGGVQGNGIHP